MPRKAIVDRIEINRDGTIGVRYAKQIIEGNDILEETWHRTTFIPEIDIKHQMDLVDEHLIQLGYGKVVNNNTLIEFINFSRSKIGPNKK